MNFIRLKTYVFGVENNAGYVFIDPSLIVSIERIIPSPSLGNPMSIVKISTEGGPIHFDVQETPEEILEMAQHKITETHRMAM